MLSKVFAYLLFLLVGLLLSMYFYRKSAQKRFVKLLLAPLMFILPFCIYFIFSPIYQGDFSNVPYKVKNQFSFSEPKLFTLIVLPNCKYCVSALPIVRNMLRQSTNLKLEIRIMGNKTKDSLKYVKLLGIPNQGIVRLSNDSLARNLLKLTQGEFPTFVISEKGKLVSAWHNDSFGVQAMDEVIEFFE